MFSDGPMQTQLRVIALLCLIAICSSALGMLPALVVFLGELDRDHQVSVAAVDGQLEVHFHHAGQDQSHDSSTGDLTPEAKGHGDSHADHVMKFGSAHDSVLSQRAIASGYQVQYVAVREAELWHPVLLHDAAVGHARPPPDLTAESRCLRSVVLLV